MKIIGLDDASRNFYLKIAVRCKYDGAFFIFKEDGVVLGLVGIHVDDIDHAGY